MILKGKVDEQLIRISNWRTSFLFWASFAIIMAFTFFLMFMMISENIFSDYPAHLDIWRFYSERGKVPFPPLYYLSFSGLSLLIPGRNSLEIGLLLLMLLSIGVKFWLTFEFLSASTNQNSHLDWLPLGLMFFFPIYLFGWEGSQLYLGKISPTIWHNGSSIFVFPFCFLLFQSTLRWLDRGKKIEILKIIVISFFILLIKPNYLFCFIPSLPIFLLIQRSSKSRFLHSIFISTVLFILVMLSKYVIYDLNDVSSIFYNFHSKDKVILSPFLVWNHFAESPVLDMLSSFVFVICAFLFFWKNLIQVPEVVFSSLNLGIGILIYLLFAESGPSWIDGNFFWQLPITLFIVLLTILKKLVRMYQASHDNLNGVSWKYGICLATFVLHVASGVYYIAHLIWTGSYF